MSTPTLKDIAQLAGVSTATASRVINGNHRGSLQVRTAVMRAVAALRYTPNPHAKQLGHANGGSKRTHHKVHWPDAIAVRAPERKITQNSDSWDLYSRILSLTNENAQLKRVIAELTSELRQTKEGSGGNVGAIRLTRRADH
jgi:Bacterial regulatory proteins, lacI family